MIACPRPRVGASPPGQLWRPGRARPDRWWGPIPACAGDAGTEPHRLTIVRTDCPPDVLPLENGQVRLDVCPGDQRQALMLEWGGPDSPAFLPGQSASGVPCEAGARVLDCDLPGHFGRGEVAGWDFPPVPW